MYLLYWPFQSELLVYRYVNKLRNLSGVVPYVSMLLFVPGPCGSAPETESYCSDHYWYGPNKCDSQYCRVTEEKYLQWQCKKTCGLCNVDPSQKEMNQICDRLIPAEVRAKYGKNLRTTNAKPKPPQKFFNDEIVTAKPLPFIFKESSRPSTTSPRTTSKQFKKKTSNSPIITAKPSKRKNKNTRNKSTKQIVKETPRSSSSRKSGGFVVISDPDRRRKLRSYWMRAG